MIVAKKREPLDTPISTRLPYSHLASANTLMTKSGELICIIKIEGFDVETSEPSEVNQLHQSLVTVLNEIPSECVIWTHAFRRKSINVKPSKSDEHLTNMFSKSYYNAYNNHEKYTTDYYLSIVLKNNLFKTQNKLTAQISSKFNRHNARIKILNGTKKLNQITDQVLMLLQNYGSIRLGVENNRVDMLSPIGYILNFEYKHYLLPEAEIASILPNKRLSFGKNCVQLTDEFDQSNQFIGMLSFKKYGAVTVPSMLSPLLKLPQDMIISHIFQPIEKLDAKDQIERLQKQFIQVKDNSISQVDEITDALDDLGADRVQFGYHTGVISCKAKNIEQLNENLIQASKSCLEVGVKPVRESVNLESAFWSQFPGNISDLRRKALISSSNVADMVSFHKPDEGHQGENHLGAPIITLETPSNSQYYFNFHQKGSKNNISLGHTTIIGPSGGGKTTLLCALNCMLGQFNAKSFIFDYRQGMAVYVLASSGEYHTFEVGRPTGINPIPQDDTPKNRQYLMQFITALVTRNGELISAIDEQIISQAIDGIYNVPKKVRNLSTLCTFFGEDWKKYKNLKTWLLSEQGSRGYLFDNATDSLNLDSAVVGVDLTMIMEDQTALLPMMLYLFNRIESGFDGRLHNIILDEGWQFLNHPFWEKALSGWLASFRKENAFVVFATQNPHEVAQSKLSYGLIQGAATNIYLPNQDASKSDYQGTFNLNDREFEIVTSLLPQSYYFLIKQAHTGAVARLNLKGIENFIRVFSGNQALYKEALALQERYGFNAKNWLKQYMGCTHES